MKNKKRYTIISNTVLALVIVFVTAICFIPSSEEVFGETYAQPFYNGNKTSEKVSVMFNVYENKDNVNKILDIASSKNVKFTFFMGGCFADDNNELLFRIVNEGHELANHGYFHKDHKKLNYANNKSEILNTQSLLQTICGVSPTLFAPPSGSFGESTLKVCEEAGLSVIMWSKDTIDWRDHDENLIISRATKNLKGGDLILMHPTNESVSALPTILDKINGAGLSQVTVTDCLQ